MWTAILGLLRKLFAPGTKLAIGSRNQSADGVQVGDQAGVVAVGQGITVVQGLPMSTGGAVIPFGKLESEMPALFAEMRRDLSDRPVAREFILQKRAWTYNADPNNVPLVYYFDDHSDLRSQLRVLENYGLIRDIAFNDVGRFVMEEVLVEYLRGDTGK